MSVTRRAFLLRISIPAALGLAVAACSRGPSPARAAQEPALEVHLVAEEGARVPTQSFPSWTDAEAPVVVERTVVAANGDVERVERTTGTTPDEQAYAIRLTRAAATRFEEVTGAAIGRRLAVVIDGKVAMAPVIRTRIVGGQVVVTAHDPAVLERLARLTPPA